MKSLQIIVAGIFVMLLSVNLFAQDKKLQKKMAEWINRLTEKSSTYNWVKLFESWGC